MRPIHVLRALGVVLNTLVFGLIVILVCLFERDGKLGYRVAKLWIAINLWLSGVRLKARGLENLDPSRSYVFMSNHRSNTDIVALGWALWDYQLRWVAKKELLKVPVFGWGLKALKNIIIDRTNHAEAVRTYAEAGERMRRGISVIVFPEGTRGIGDELLPFKKGGFVLAIETGTPIVPIGIVGTAAVLPRDGWQIESGDVEVRIGKPIETANLTVKDRDQLVARVREEIHKLMNGATLDAAPRAAGGP
ncbi:MAG: lysophospholipid acyltransferase family protein [Candidatus Binatia bacterium]